MKTLNVAVVGLGWVAGAHIAAFQTAPNVRVSAVCSRRDPSPDDVKKRYGIEAKVFTDFADVLADPDIDIVCISGFNALHPSQCIAALEAGKHVYVEKPLALDWKSCLDMQAAEKNSRGKVCVGFECRFSQQLTLTRAIIEQGLIGDIHYGEADYYHGIGPWYGQYAWNCRKDGGGSALLSGGCHALDALLMAMPAAVEEVTAYTGKSRAECFKEYEYPPCSVTLLKFADGRIGKVTTSIDCLQPYYFHIHLLGSAGSLLDNKLSTTRLPGLRRDKWTTLETAMLDSGDVEDHPYEPQMKAFVEAIRTGAPVPLTSLADAIETHRIIFASQLSAECGRPVRLSELPG